ncbi:MAG: SPOUT family RNA methylase [Aigarchaeota archaeon]|nr:SPOUT family RNA methylase [Candidatus Calditenuis fumarioli]
MELIVKTPLGLERLVRSKILLLDREAEVVASPLGLRGLVIVERCTDPESLLSKISSEVPEAERVIRPLAVVRSEPDEIARAAAEVVRDRIGPGESFAVRTVRRAKSGFTSLEINARVGAVVQNVTGARVDLDNPEKVVMVEVIGDRTAIAVVEGSEEHRKMVPGKVGSWRFFRRVSVVQMPYLGSIEGAREVGRRVGRFAQAFEVGELVIAPAGECDAFELSAFIDGVREGIESRLEVQRRTYHRRVEPVRVVVQDLYQLVLSRRDEPIVVFEPEGRELYREAERVAEVLRRGRRINLLFGSREGIPKGVFRLADAVIDLCPDVTLPTELAAPAALIALYTAIRGLGEEEALAGPGGGEGAEEEGDQGHQHP